ncbi:hypothetical protein JKF63_04874 [Porcisia hertigi]|uniref:Uncharacterized protein n=1 Tax=Porcisia hertigi TaxID=2761500 RepID=A0A836IFL8_9TRYP|nr:hypothetical protein JKF63_04874 [Porcisia hertigi]
MSIVATPSTFAEAGVQLHEKLLSTVQADKNTITPTPLLIRVLRRTALDFADVIVDGRCATGTSQVGSAAAIWVHNTNNRPNASSAAVGSSSTSSPQQTSRGSPASSPGTGGAGDDSAMPLYRTEAALSECRSLLVLYTLHCLLSANQELSWNAGGCSNGASAHVRADADGRVRQLPPTARNWAPEVSIIVAETEESAVKLYQMCRLLGEACGLHLNVVLHIGNKLPASLILPPNTSATEDTTHTEDSATPAAASEFNKEEDGSTSGTERRSPAAEQPYLASIIIATAQGFLSWNLNALLSAGVDVLIADGDATTAPAESVKDAASASATAASADSPIPEVRRVYPHIASIVVEEMGGASVTSPMGAEKAVQQWRGVHQTLYTAVLRQNPRYVPALHLHPHYMWVCRGPVSGLPATLRQCFSRRSRRYYQIQPSTYISPLAVSLMPHPHEGLSSPAESLGIRLVLSQNQADKEAQLRRIVTDRSGLFHRVLLLTHNKEVAQLSALIATWGVSKDMPNASTASVNSLNSVVSTRRMDSLGAQQQCHAAFLQSCEAVEQLSQPASSSTTPPCGSPVVVTLVAWDALTSLDIMDVDVIVQYYPPQKSLTVQEWAEFIQILHTTVDGEREIELSLRQNRNNKEDNILSKLQQLREGITTGSPRPASGSFQPQRPLPVLVTLMAAADFTLSAYFLHQYMYSGATGTLSRAATAMSLTSTCPVPGRPGVQEPVESPLPVLDISPMHPYFIPLVCGHTGEAEWPATAPGSPPQPRASVAGLNGAEASLVPTLASGEAVTLKRVLLAKLRKEQRRLEAPGSSWDRSATANSLGTSGNPSVTVVPSSGRLSAQGNNANAVGGGEGSSLNPNKTSGGAGRGRLGSSDEGNILAKLAKGAGVGSSSQAASCTGAAGGSTSGGVRSTDAMSVRANNRGGAGTSTGVADCGSGNNGKNQRQQQRGGGGGGKEASSPTRGGGSSTNSSNRNARSSPAQSNTTGGRLGNSGRDHTNSSSNGTSSSITGASAAKAAGTAAGSDNSGRGGSGSKKESDKGPGTARSPLTSKSGLPIATTASAVAKDSEGVSGGDAKVSGNKRRSRNARGKKQQSQPSP